MNSRILSIVLLLLSSITAFSQSALTYSLSRPAAGGNLNLLEIDLAAGTESIVKTYLASEIQDYNPEVTAFDGQNNRFITSADIGNNENLIAINVANGNIDFSFQSTTQEVFSIEQNGSKTYSLTRPIGGGNLNLVEFDLAAGTETIVKTYLPSELQDYNPEVTAFDEQNNRFITAGDISNNEMLIAINVANGDIDYSFQSTTQEIFCIEQSGSKSYSLSRPIGGGNLNLTEFDLAAGSESIVKTYLPSELQDYNPEVTTFDVQHNRFITLGDISNNESLIAIDVANGSIDYSYQSPTQEIFSIEANGNVAISSNDPFSENNFFDLYPNPVLNILSIKSSNSYKLVEILDLQGKVLSSLPGSETEFNLSNLPAGVYCLRITGSAETHTKRFIKQ